MRTMTLHEVASLTLPIGIVCVGCLRRVLRTAEQIGAAEGDHRTLEQAGVRCGRCRAQRFDVFRFDTERSVRAFMKSEPS
jgi:hypothetical protein